MPQENENNAYDGLQQARKPFADYIDQFQNWKGHSIVHQDVDSFRDANRIFFDPGDTIESVSVQRQFLVPTFVMLDGCGTAAPGALDFVREFNKRGATTEIATATEIDPTMAGLFAATFIKKLQDHSTDHTYSVARAQFDATREVSKASMTATETYGPRTLMYTMLGNGALKVCVPSSKR